MNAPPEIIIRIASLLPVEDLKNFRLADHACAAAGLSNIPQNGLSVLDTAEHLESLSALLRSSAIANNTKRLTLFCGIWPFHFWGKGQYHQESFVEDQPTKRYFDDDVEALFGILFSLPNLQHFQISIHALRLKDPAQLLSSEKS